MDMIDYGEHAENEVDEKEIIKKIVQLSDTLAKEKKELDDIEAEAARKKQVVKHLENEKIPSLMGEIGLEVFATKTHIIEIKDVIGANISQANEKAAYDWLDENGHGGMIKRKVVVSFDRNQQEAARELQDKIRAKYPGVKEEQKIHNGTLRSWVREQLEEGKSIPAEISYERIPTAKIKTKKE